MLVLVVVAAALVLVLVRCAVVVLELVLVLVLAEAVVLVVYTRTVLVLVLASMLVLAVQLLVTRIVLVLVPAVQREPARHHAVEAHACAQLRAEQAAHVCIRCMQCEVVPLHLHACIHVLCALYLIVLLGVSPFTFLFGREDFCMRATGVAGSALQLGTFG